MVDWQRIWNDDGKIRRFSSLRIILLLLSFFYRLIIALRNFLYDRRIFASLRLACPVISIGNITVGGTGKTPCVVMVTKILQRRGFHPAVISRGYGGKKAKNVNIVSDGGNILLDAEIAGDEPLMLARLLPGVPVITGARRIDTGNVAIKKFGANVIICDDAFQHRKIFRDVDIVLLDCKKPLSNSRLLPAGALREPPGSLGRADCLIVTRSDEEGSLNKEIKGIADSFQLDVFLSRHVPKDVIKGDGRATFPPEELRHKKICAFCGIAQPDSFKKILLDARAEVVSFNPYPDHYAYEICDIEELKDQFFRLQADYLMTTQKDAMRLEKYSDFLKMLSILRVEMEIMPSAAALENFLLQRLSVTL